MNKIKLSIITALTTISSLSFAQDTQTETKVESKKKIHGNFFITWGYQHNAYTESSIQFINHNNGNNYDFTLHNAKAHEQPDFEDLLHRPISVPQYVFHIGYLFNDKHDLGIELSWDHLKYVVTDNQVLHLTGNINGVNYDKDTLVDPKFVHFEHTNGNNYLMASIVKRKKLYTTKNGYLRISAIGKFGFGGLVPKTDSHIMGKNNDGPFQLSGWVTGLTADLRIDLFRYFFIEGSVKGCFANYTNAIIHDKGKAKHTFWSAQYIAAFGFNIPLSKE